MNKINILHLYPQDIRISASFCVHFQRVYFSLVIEADAKNLRAGNKAWVATK